MRKVVIPPYAESPDSHRCGPTVIRMILKHFIPNKKWTIKEVDKICQYIKGKNTYSLISIAGMVKKGFEVIRIDDFDYKKYAADYKKHLIQVYGQKNADQYMSAVDHQAGAVAANELLQSSDFRHIKRDWNWNDVDVLLNEGFLIMVWVNSRKLYSRHDPEMENGHYLLIYGYNKEYKVVQFHDGGSYLELDDGSYGVNRWKSGRIGLEHFMYAARNTFGKNGDCISAFRLKK